MFSHKSPGRAARAGEQRADQIARLIDEAQSDMRGPGTATELGHSLRTTLPPSVAGNAASPSGGRRSATQEEEAEEVFREVAEHMILVFDGQEGRGEEYIRGNPEETLEAVVIQTDDQIWTARDSESAYMGDSGWRIDQIDSGIAEVIADVLQPENVFKTDLPEEDPEIPDALYLNEEGELAVSQD